MHELSCNSILRMRSKRCSSLKSHPKLVLPEDWLSITQIVAKRRSIICVYLLSGHTSCPQLSLRDPAVTRYKSCQRRSQRFEVTRNTLAPRIGYCRRKSSSADKEKKCVQIANTQEESDTEHSKLIPFKPLFDFPPQQERIDFLPTAPASATWQRSDQEAFAAAAPRVFHAPPLLLCPEL